MKNTLFLLLVSVSFIGCKPLYLNSPLDNPEEFLFSQNKNESSELILSTTFQAEPTTKVPEEFIWGFNGHSINSEGYRSPGSINEQLKLLNEFQTTHYRTNVDVDKDGIVNKYKDSEERWVEFLLKSKQANITILPLFHLREYDFDRTETEAFNYGKKQAFGFVKRYGHNFKVYELGNEMERHFLAEGLSGSEVSHYEVRGMKVYSSYLKGMIEGVKEADPEAKTIINSAGRTKYGFFQILENEDVDYDYLGFHFYSKEGTITTPFYDVVGGQDVLDELYRITEKPVWITEINQHQGSRKYSEENQSSWMHSFIKEVKSRPYVKALFVYELLDQPILCDGEGYEALTECQYGLIEWRSKYTQYRYKQAAETLKFMIEEAKYGEMDVKNYLSTHNTEIADLEDSYLQTNFQEIQEFVDKAYAIIFKRNANAKEERYWKKKLKKEDVSLIQSLQESKELYQKAIIAGYEKRTGFPFYREGFYNIQDQK